MHRDTFANALWALAVAFGFQADARHGAWLGVATLALLPLVLRLLVRRASKTPAPAGQPTALEIEQKVWQDLETGP